MKQTFDLMKRLSTFSMSGSGVLSSLSEWIINNRNIVADLALADVAKAAGVSETTVFRLSQQLGFSGYREMRMTLAELRGIAMGHALSEETENAGSQDPYSAITSNTVTVHTSILKSTAQLVDPHSLRRAVLAIQAAKVIQVFGFGSSVAPVVDIYQRLIRFGFVANNYSDPHVLTAVTSNPPPGSLFLAISFSGQSKDVVDALESASRQALNSILITSNPESAATVYADVVLHSAPAGALVGSETVATRVSQLAIIDMICTGLALEHPRKNEFLRNASVIEHEIARKRIDTAQSDPAENTTTMRKSSGSKQ